MSEIFNPGAMTGVLRSDTFSLASEGDSELCFIRLLSLDIRAIDAVAVLWSRVFLMQN